MNEQFAKLNYKISRILKNHQTFMVMLVVLLVVAVAFVRINQLNHLSVDQAEIDKKKAEISTVKFNQDTIKQIEKLKDSNVDDPGTSLPENRQNPFNE